MADNLGMNELLADCFSGVYFAEATLVPSEYQLSDSRMSDLAITYDAVRRVLLNLGAAKPARPDLTEWGMNE